MLPRIFAQLRIQNDFTKGCLIQYNQDADNACTDSFDAARKDSFAFLLSYWDDPNIKTRADLDLQSVAEAYVNQLKEKISSKISSNGWNSLPNWQKQMHAQYDYNYNALVSTMRAIYNGQARIFSTWRANHSGAVGQFPQQFALLDLGMRTADTTQSVSLSCHWRTAR